MLDTLDFKSVSVKMSLRLPRLKLNENTLGCSEDTKMFPLSFKEGGKRSFFFICFLPVPRLEPISGRQSHSPVVNSCFCQVLTQRSPGAS